MSANGGLVRLRPLMASGKGGGRSGASRKPSGVDLAAVRELIRLMDEHHLREIEIANGSSRVRLVRDLGASEPVHDATSPRSPAAVPPAPPADVSPAAEPQPTRGRPIISPMVGTFYRASSPEAPAFVEVGSVVEKGDTLCIIEAMKMMNEIEAEFRGRVTAVLADNGQTVEYGEQLFLVEPLDS